MYTDFLLLRHNCDRAKYWNREARCFSCFCPSALVSWSDSAMLRQSCEGMNGRVWKGVWFSGNPHPESWVWTNICYIAESPVTSKIETSRQVSSSFITKYLRCLIIRSKMMALGLTAQTLFWTASSLFQEHPAPSAVNGTDSLLKFIIYELCRPCHMVYLTRGLIRACLFHEIFHHLLSLATTYSWLGPYLWTVSKEDKKPKECICSVPLLPSLSSLFPLPSILFLPSLSVLASPSQQELERGGQHIHIYTYVHVCVY